ncbi:hypothetical protein KC19_8G195900 [Ceratodon purpureus]|uniref:Uncharacterized protein n=1 Tax=Ceratodon purpureus TaxID=3225 RepID=A0A8T0H5C2_CERPU|nr:hypothetical protein KC19_8G195900 [Ceratodon purpureus]
MRAQVGGGRIAMAMGVGAGVGWREVQAVGCSVGAWRQRCGVHVRGLQVRVKVGGQLQRMGGRCAAVRRGEAGEGGMVGNSGEEGLVATVGTPAPAPASLRDWYLADKQLVVISFTALVTAGFMGILVAAAIPSLLAIKKAAEALEKLADTAREELPGTMAAIRLSGMEISDLTMELNDLGQEISKGVRSSARVLSSAETGMRQVGGIASNVWQGQAVVPAQAMQPLVARTARQVRDSLVQTRTLVRNLQVLSRVSGWIGSLQGRTPILIIPSDKKEQKS